MNNSDNPEELNSQPESLGFSPETASTAGDIIQLRENARGTLPSEIQNDLKTLQQKRAEVKGKLINDAKMAGMSMAVDFVLPYIPGAELVGEMLMAEVAKNAGHYEVKWIDTAFAGICNMALAPFGLNFATNPVSISAARHAIGNFGQLRQIDAEIRQAEFNNTANTSTLIK